MAGASTNGTAGGGGGGRANGGAAGAQGGATSNGGGAGGAGGAAGASGGAGGCPGSTSNCQPQASVELDAGDSFSCELLQPEGSVKCWGNGLLIGQGNGVTIGDDESPSVIAPIELTKKPGVRAVRLSVGQWHACAVLSDGTLTCWGDNFFGQLGYGRRGDYVGDDERPSSVGAVQVSRTPGLKVVDVVAGGTHTCALLSDHSVKCWGQGMLGQLGQGNTNDIGDDEPPSAIGPISLSRTPGVFASRLGAGEQFTCAVMSNGGLKCWGYGAGGQLGYGNIENIGDDELPSSVGDVPLTTKPGVTAVAMAGGVAHTCALLSNGEVKCWGFAFGGRLGYGNDDNIGDLQPPASVGALELTRAPGVVATRLAVGGAHACALLSDSSVTCWGWNELGQLGYGNTRFIGDDERPVSAGPVSVTNDPRVEVLGIAAGHKHNCAALSNGNVRCWGDFSAGELGDPETQRVGNIGDDELPSSLPPLSL